MVDDRRVGCFRLRVAPLAEESLAATKLCFGVTRAARELYYEPVQRGRGRIRLTGALVSAGQLIEDRIGIRVLRLFFEQFEVGANRRLRRFPAGSC